MENACFGSLDCHFRGMSRGKCSFWRFGWSFLVRVSWKMLVLEVWIVIFRGKSRGKCLSWKSGLSLLGEVSWKMLVLEVWIVIFRGKSRGKCLSWKSGLSFLGGSLVENACLGSLDCHF